MTAGIMLRLAVVTVCLGLWCAAGCGAAGVAAPGATYVVDNACAWASDENPGTEAKPWKTIQRAARQVRSGDTVYVMEGTYEGRVTFEPGTSGSEGKPVRFIARPRHAVRTQGFDTKNCDYLRLEGFVITPAPSDSRPGGIGILVTSRHVEIVDNIFEKNRWFAISGRSWPEDNYRVATDVHVAFNRLDQCGFGFFISGRNWLVERNEARRMVWQMDGDDCDYSRTFGLDHLVRDNRFHGSRREEVKESHIDGLQGYADNQEYGTNIRYERNVIFDTGQALYFSNSGKNSRPETKNWQFIENIISHEPGSDIINSKAISMVRVPQVTAAYNTIHDMLFMGMGIHYSPDMVVKGNLISGAKGYGYGGDESPNATVDYNLMFQAGKPFFDKVNRLAPHDLFDADPLFVDAARCNFRLKKGSPAIGAGENGRTIGALEYPNVYYVDSRHPGADDEGFGYPGWPFRTVAAALRMAEPGETVVLRGGIYRELVRPACDDVTIRAAQGEKVIVSGADVVEGWQRRREGWTAPLPRRPAKLLRDGAAFDDFTYDESAHEIAVKGFDPRLHVFETVVREHGIDLRGRKGLRVQGIEIVNTSGARQIGDAP